MSKKESLKSVKLEYSLFREKTKAALAELKYPSTRTVAVVDVADGQGKINGMTIVELLTMVKMAESTGERVVLSAGPGKSLIISLEKIPTINISSF